MAYDTINQNVYASTLAEVKEELAELAAHHLDDLGLTVIRDITSNKRYGVYVRIVLKAQ